MRAREKRESLLVLLIVVPIVIMFALISSSAPEIIVVDPPQPTILAEQDLILAQPNGKVEVGNTTRDELMAVFPDGANLGRSGMYHPEGLDLWLTMSRNEDVVIRMDITDPRIATSRGIRANDSFDKVVETYGPNYTLAYDQDTPDKFDASYGGDQYVVFKVEDNTVKKILIGAPVSLEQQLASAQKDKKS